MSFICVFASMGGASITTENFVDKVLIVDKYVPCYADSANTFARAFLARAWRGTVQLQAGTVRVLAERSKMPKRKNPFGDTAPIQLKTHVGFKQAATVEEKQEVYGECMSSKSNLFYLMRI